MEILKLILVRFDRAIVMQITNMEESFRRGDNKESPCYLAKNGIKIISADYPEIFEDKILLWGNDKSQDHRLLTKAFDTNQGRDDFIERLKIAFSDWARENFSNIKGNYSTNLTTFGDVWTFY